MEPTSNTGYQLRPCRGSTFTWEQIHDSDQEDMEVKRLKTAKGKALTHFSYSNSAATSHKATPTQPRQKASSHSTTSKLLAAAHRRRGRKGKSNYRGVCVTREGKWRAVIYKERKQLYLGVYQTEVEAAMAHDTAARAHFGDAACVNFPDQQAGMPNMSTLAKVKKQTRTLQRESTNSGISQVQWSYSQPPPQMAPLGIPRQILDLAFEFPPEDAESGNETDSAASYSSASDVETMSYDSASSASLGSSDEEGHAFPLQADLPVQVPNALLAFPSLGFEAYDYVLPDFSMDLYSDSIFSTFADVAGELGLV